MESIMDGCFGKEKRVISRLKIEFFDAPDCMRRLPKGGVQDGTGLLGSAPP
jgi:hypothetical protein